MTSNYSPKERYLDSAGCDRLEVDDNGFQEPSVHCCGAVQTAVPWPRIIRSMDTERLGCISGILPVTVFNGNGRPLRSLRTPKLTFYFFYEEARIFAQPGMN